MPQASPEPRTSPWTWAALALVLIVWWAGFVLVVGLSIDANKPLKPAEQEVKRGD